MENELDILADLGLTPYESKVFLTLIRIRKGTSSDIAKACGVPRTSIYNTCAVLVNLNLIEMTSGKSSVMSWGIKSNADAINVFLKMAKNEHRKKLSLISSLDRVISEKYGMAR